ncbi:MAG: sulfite exporter TauE/SafE family protein [Candidatus Korarchaeum sp.]
MWSYVMLAGFIAELIDSSLGMAYGVISNSILLSLGFGAALASATVHSSEVFLTIASGLSHIRLGNMDRKLFLSLLIPGSTSAVLGAYVLSSVDTSFLKPLIQSYLIMMGVLIILRSRGVVVKGLRVRPSLLGFIGGFLDATGGGGWGPVVTGTLIANGSDVRKTIGSVNASEFFVTVSQTITFLIFSKVSWDYTLFLLVGGIPSAFLGAYLCSRIKRDKLMTIVGMAIIVINTYGIMIKIV